MKKVFILAAVAAIALTSCQREKDINGNTAGDNEVAFSLSGAATRAADEVSPMTEGVSISLGRINNFELFMDETVTDLNYAAETRGTPVYTENVGYLYKDMLGVYTDGAGGVDASFARLESKMGDEGWLYQHRYAQDIWPDENTEVQFYLYMPTDMIDESDEGFGVTSISHASGKTTVEYTSPLTAADQEDIIFGGIKMNHKTYMGHYSSKGGAPVVLYHALTGVKFAIKNTDAELAGIQINKITFNDLVNSGTFEFNTADKTFNWTSTDAEANNVLYQEFESGDLVTYDAEEHASNNFPESFYKAGTVNNINKADASYTFWLIPQTIEESDATLRIDYTMNSRTEYMVIRLGDLYKGSSWNAGQIRTFTFRLDEVKVKITDEIDMAEESTETIDTPWGPADFKSYQGSKKTDVTITNTGNTDAFIRVALVGQWRDEDGDPVFGFTDYTHGVQLVASWYEDQFGPNAQHQQGHFTGLPGANWELGSDGYYYYKKAVPAGTAIADDLFEEYEVGSVPGAAVAGEVKDIYFTLEIAVQAISAKKLDGTNYTYDAAWARALAME